MYIFFCNKLQIFELCLPCSHFCGVTDNKHQDNPAEEGRHGVVPSVGAGDSIVKVGVPIEQNDGWV